MKMRDGLLSQKPGVVENVEVIDSQFFLIKQAYLSKGLHRVRQNVRRNGEYIGVMSFGNNERMILTDRLGVKECEGGIGLKDLPGMDLTCNDRAENAFFFHYSSK